MAVFSRTINVEMDWIGEGAFEIRGALNDNVHSVEARLMVGYPDFIIKEASGGISRMPYPGYCQGAYAVLPKFVGERIGRGFRKRVGELAGGAASCNHLHTLINDMATCAFQMNYYRAKNDPQAIEAFGEIGDDHARRRELVLSWMPQLRNSCYVFSEAADSVFGKSGDGAE